VVECLPSKREALSKHPPQKKKKKKKGSSLTTSWLEKAGAVAHAQQSGAGKLVKVAVGGKLHRRGEDPLSM
jgi:hypothetical protein